MEVVVGILIGAILALAMGGRKRARAKQTQLTKTTPRQAKKGLSKQETDELITVILPTINNDK